MWYFFAVQRMIVCWIYACRNENGCDTSTLGCHKHSFRNITFLNDCSANTTLFDFGIFTSVLQTDIPGSTNFLNKLSNCFCWGLRNLRFVHLIPSIMHLTLLLHPKKKNKLQLIFRYLILSSVHLRVNFGTCIEIVIILVVEFGTCMMHVANIHLSLIIF